MSSSETDTSVYVMMSRYVHQFHTVLPRSLFKSRTTPAGSQLAGFLFAQTISSGVDLDVLVAFGLLRFKYQPYMGFLAPILRARGIQ